MADEEKAMRASAARLLLRNDAAKSVAAFAHSAFPEMLFTIIACDRHAFTVCTDFDAPRLRVQMSKVLSDSLASGDCNSVAEAVEQAARDLLQHDDSEAPS